MLLKYFYDATLAQASYMVGCQATGEALVIDPARDVTPFLKVAEEEGLTITHVTETHIHADFVSGTRELSDRTGARMYLSDMGDDDWKYGFVNERTVLVNDGDTWMVGNVKVEVLHTPGHTPEHISFMITDTAGADKPIGIFTGDFLFVGDIGRPDLLDEAAGFVDTRFKGAQLQYANIERFKELPDYLQIWPAHGAGSACGKALGAVPSSTLGYEKLFNPAFQFNNEEDFVNWLLADQPEAPKYFAQMKYINKVGPELLKNLPEVEHVSEYEAIANDGAQIVDARTMPDFAQAHLPNSMNVPGDTRSFNTYVGWYVDYGTPFYLIANPEDVDRLKRELYAIGVDNVMGYFTPDVISGNTVQLPQMTAAELHQRMSDVRILDVRGRKEYEEVRIAGAKNIPMGYIVDRINEIPREGTLVTHCAGGLRSQVAASVLKKHGFDNVVNLEGGIDAWQAEGLPVEKDALESAVTA
jgi:hydroxyacylglutathione hydrolase